MYEELITKYGMRRDGENIRCSPAPKGKDLEDIKSNKGDVLKEIDTLVELRGKEQSEREERWETERLEKIEKERPMLESMNKKAQEFRGQIPEDGIPVKIEKTGNMDGDDMLEYSVDGVKLSWRDIVYVGTASAIRPGAMGAFASVRVAYITRTKLEEIKLKNQAEKTGKEEKIQAEKQRIETLTNKAKNTGEKQLLNKWVTTKCMNHNYSECSFDVAGEYAYADGSKKIEYTCCY